MEKKIGPQKGSVVARYGFTPFSVMDANHPSWQKEKKRWLEEGIESREGRRDKLIFHDSESLGRLGFQQKTGTSVFDPFLCELVYRWFAFEGATVLDPFAGGSVRGIVAARMGLSYTGIELRPEQVRANKKQWERLKKTCSGQCRWIIGDSLNKTSRMRTPVDFLFTCPPYHNLEKYSRRPDDLSNMEWWQFEATYKKIIQNVAAQLNENRFACFVVGDIRDQQGFYRDFPGVTIRAFEAAGVKLYNHAIIATPIASLPLRIHGMFSGNRKLGKRHQDVLVFYKGDPSKIKSIYGTL